MDQSASDRDPLLFASRQSIGEGSSSVSEPDRVKQTLPSVPMIVILRDPVERAHSHYLHNLRIGAEDCATFEEAIEREPERLEGELERARFFGLPGLFEEKLAHARALADEYAGAGDTETRFRDAAAGIGDRAAEAIARSSGTTSARKTTPPSLRRERFATQTLLSATTPVRTTGTAAFAARITSRGASRVSGAARREAPPAWV